MIAPERIRAAWHASDDIGTPKSLTAFTPASRFFDTDPHLVEYIRADLHEATKVQLAECEARLRKVVEALREIRLEYDPSDDSLNARTMYDIACDVLAEIEKGGV